MFSLVERNHRNLLAPVEQVFNDFYNDFFQGVRNQNGLMRIKSKVDYPKLDCYYKDNCFIIEAEVPGLNKENLTIELVDNDTVIKIAGQKSEEYKDKNYNYEVKELRRSRFERLIALPNEIPAESRTPEAILKDGMLTLKWKGVVAQASPNKRIDIKEEG